MSEQSPSNPPLTFQLGTSSSSLSSSPTREVTQSIAIQTPDTRARASGHHTVSTSVPSVSSIDAAASSLPPAHTPSLTSPNSFQASNSASAGGLILPPARARSRSVGSAQADFHKQFRNGNNKDRAAHHHHHHHHHAQRSRTATIAQAAQAVLRGVPNTTVRHSPKTDDDLGKGSLAWAAASAPSVVRTLPPSASSLSSNGNAAVAASPTSTTLPTPSLLHELGLIPDLGGRAQSAASSLRRIKQSFSATNSPQATDLEYLPTDLLEIGDLTSDFMFSNVIGGSGYTGEPASTNSVAGLQDSYLYHPEGGLGSGVIGNNQNTVGEPIQELDEVDMSLILMRNLHERSMALEQKISAKTKQDAKQQQQLQQQQDSSGSGSGSGSSGGSHHHHLKKAASAPATSIMNNIAEEDELSSDSAHRSISSSSSSSNDTTPLTPSSVQSYPSVSSSNSSSTLLRSSLSEVQVLTRAIEQVTALLYKSKLSQSLRTVQMRRLMREQFLNDVKAPTAQTADDRVIARWIASSALSNLEIEEAADAEDGGSNANKGADEAAVESEKIVQAEQEDDEEDDLVESKAVELSRPNVSVSEFLPHSTSGTFNSSSPLQGEIILPSSLPFTPPTSSPLSGGSDPSPIAAIVIQPPSSTSSASSQEKRSTTPIIQPGELNISNLIGSGFNTKRGSAGAPRQAHVPASSSATPASGSVPSPVLGVSSNSTTPATSPSPSDRGSFHLSGRRAAANVATTPSSPGLASTHATSLTPSGTSPSLAATTNTAHIPLTAIALVNADQAPTGRSTSQPAINSTASIVSPNPNSGGVPSPSGSVTRSISDHRVYRSNRDSMGLAGLLVTPSTNTSANASGNNSANTTPSATRRPSRIYFTLTPLVNEALNKVWQWEFDLWGFVEQVPDTPLSTLTCYLLERWGLFSTFNIDRGTFHRFIQTIENGYLDNPYHNKIHAADVVQNIHVLLLGFMQKPTKESVGALCTSLTPLDVFSSIIAAAIHDYKHTGTTNLFHTNTISDLAICYNDVSVLENMHLSEAFNLILRNKEYDIFASFSREQKRECRETIIQMVLATDMKNHISMLTDLQATVESKKATGKWFDVSSRSDRLLLLKNCLHLSDVANPTKPTATCVKWAECIVNEWFAQGDMERNLKIDISPMMDRRNANVEKSQIGFIDFFISPLFNTWQKITPLATIPLEYLKLNRAYWESRAKHNEASQHSTVAAAAAATPSASTSASAGPSSGASSAHSSPNKK